MLRISGVGSHLLLWNYTDSTGPEQLQQGEGAPGCPQEGSTCPPDSSELVQECVNQFKVTDLQLQQIQTSILCSVEQALRGQASLAPAVRMLPTYVGFTPHGTEQGDFLVLELGATDSLRVLWVTLTGIERHRREPQSQEVFVPQEVMMGPGQQLFDFAACCLSEFLDGLLVGDQSLQLGFNFSFLFHQMGLDRSTLISWIKSFRCSDVEGQDVVQLLRDATERQRTYSIDVVTVVNDTVGCELGTQPCDVGLVVDTGTSACYMEEVQHVGVLDEDRGRVYVSMEWGSSRNYGTLGLVLTTFDRILNQEFLNPGSQRFEKMIGGLYLGELVPQVLAYLAQHRVLFGGCTSPVLSGCFLPEHVARMADPLAGTACVHAVLQDLGLSPGAADTELVHVCAAMCPQAAQLCIAALAAILTCLQHNWEQQRLQIAVATGGQVFEQHPRFLSILQETMKLLAPECDVSFTPSVARGGRGVAIVTAVAACLAALRLLEKMLAWFQLIREQLAGVQAQMWEAMAKGLGEASSLTLPTYVQATPDGSKRRDFLALDLGASTSELLVHEATEGVQITNQVYLITECVAQSSGQQLFDHILDCILDFQQKQGLSGKTPLDFTFSFPCKQLGLDQGILLNWREGFSASDCEGQDAVCLLREAIGCRAKESASKVELNVIAIINDTVGTMMSYGYEDPCCEVSLIIGTGTNVCYMEELWNVVGVAGDSGHMCINMEWGALGDDGSLSMLSTCFDASVDQAPIHPSYQRFEKMISGMYLEEIHILLYLASLGVLFRGQQTQRLQTRNIFKTKLLSEIRSDSLALRQVQAILEELGLPLTWDDALMVLEVCQVVSQRAPQLCGAGVAAVVEKSHENRGLEELTVVGMDGTLYKLHPHFSCLVEATLQELAPRCAVTFLQSDGSGKGAALVTAIACRLAQLAGI
ncbi:LOW QUALITY PROTEIN: hexokinase-3 [Rhynchonycteris naso]